MSTQRIAVSGDVHGGGFSAAVRGATVLQVQQPSVPQNITEQQVLGTNISTFTLDVPALAAQGTSDVSFAAPLGLPPFTLPRTSSGIVTVSLQLTEQGTDLLITFSQQLSYGGVAPSNIWTIPAGGTFAGAKVVGVARALALAASSAQTLTVLCSARVIGIPAASG